MARPNGAAADHKQNRLFGRRLFLSRLALAWERLWPALWPLPAIVGGFIAASLFGLWALIPGWLHLLCLIAVGATIVGVLWRARRRFRLPDRGAGLRRLERTGGVGHRPLTAVMDRVAGSVSGDRAAALWRAHRARMAAAAAKLRVTWPIAGLAARDPWAIRALVGLLVFVGLAFAGERAGPRLAAAFNPQLGAKMVVEPGQLTAWLTPPAYTGLPPISLTGSAPAMSVDTVAAMPPIAVAHGSKLIAKVSGGGGPPVLDIDQVETTFEPAGDDSFEVAREITASGSVGIAQGATRLGAWRFDVIPDHPPTMTVNDTPEKTRKGVLRLGYQAEDDYGVESVRLELALTDDPQAEPLILPLPLSANSTRVIRDAAYQDLTPHPWAGMPVRLTGIATDFAGQRGTTPVVTMVLPERPFDHPVARAVIEQRRSLALNRESQAAVQRALARIAERPDEYGDDVVAYLALRSAVARLEYPMEEPRQQSVVDLLWDVALRIEDGALSLAEQELRAAQEALRDALDGNANNQEIEELMDRLEQAMSDYLDQLDQRAQDSESQQAEEPPPGSELGRNRADFESMLNDTRDMAMTGAREAARQMLSELQEMLENMQPGQSTSNQGGQSGDELMQQLEQIAREQGELLEETFNQSPVESRERQQAEGNGQNRADRQEALRRALGDIMRELGEQGMEIPEALGRAERRMRDAREALEGGRPDRAVRPQSEAMEQLREGADSLATQFAGQQGTQPGHRRRSDRDDENRDPLGRLPPGQQGDPAGYVAIPDQAEIQRSREILEELYRRAAESRRPKPERDYIDRLLRWY